LILQTITLMKNKPSFLKLLFLSSFICIFSLTAIAQNKKISIQGFLKDANGKAVADGTYPMTFKLYNGAASVTVLWSEALPEVSVSGGIYTVQLGGTKSITTLAWDVPYFLGITVQGTELSPRTELTYAPYALSVASSASAFTVVCSGAVGDVKYSMLDPTKFTAKNGSCWVPMDGRNIAGSELASTLSITSIPNAGGLFIRGQEINGSNYDSDRTTNSAIGIQTDANASHGHNVGISNGGAATINAGSALTEVGLRKNRFDYIGIVLDEAFYPTAASTYSERPHRSSGYGYKVESSANMASQELVFKQANVTVPIPNHSHTVTQSNSGGTESRPNNINLWTYVRIN
jgi:hypothetical protein